MFLNKEKLKMDKVWLKARRSARLSEKISGLPKEVTQELSILRRKLLESNLEALRAKLSQERDDWKKLLAEKEEKISDLKKSLNEHEEHLINYRKDWDIQQKKQIEQIKNEYDSLEARSREERIKKSLFDKELTIYRNAADKLKHKIMEERETAKTLKEQWSSREKYFNELLASKEEELACLREELVEKENRFYHKQAQTEGELNLLKNELSRLRNLLSHKEADAQNTIEQAKDNVLAMQNQIEKIHEQLEFSQQLKGIDTDTLTKYNDEIQALRQEKQKLQENFDQERLRWKELWEKERNEWVKKKQEAREWEERLRYERERFVKLAWDGKTPVPNYVPNRKEGVADLTKPPIPEALKIFDRSSVARNWLISKEIFFGLFTSLRFYLSIAGAALFSLLFYNLYLALQPAKNIFYPSLNPKSVYSFADNIFLFMDASGKINMHQRGTPEIAGKEISIPEGVKDFVVEDRFLWVLAADGKRISLRFLSEPDVVQGSYFIDEPSDYLAWDGTDLWTLSSSMQRLNKHSISGKLRVVKRFQLSGLNAGGISFYKGKIWILDKNTKSLAIYKIGKTLQKVNRYILPRFGGKMVIPNDFSIGANRVWMVNTEASFLYYMTTNRLAWENFWK